MEYLKDKLKKKELTIGSWITLAHPAIAEIMAKAGFDWLVVDLEHSVITIREAEELIRVVGLCGVDPLVRLSANDPTQISRVMDAGAHGVIVPMVNTKDDAIRAVNSVKYPPVGKRGVGLARAQGYGTSFEEYKDWVTQESIVVVQVEHIKAVENLEEILNVDGVDAFIVGPYDLSGSLGVPGEFDHPKVVEALIEIRDVSSRVNATAGYHVVSPQNDLVLKRVEEGYSFVAFGVDFLYLGDMCRGKLKNLREVIRKV
jgi:2-keto-3-deoxy-L-rhamnonate aldolase RhmA